MMVLYVVLAGVLVGAGAAILLLARRPAAARRVEAENRSAVDRWMDRILARQIAYAVGQPAAEVEAAFAGQRPDLQQQVEGALGEVQMTVGRVGTGRHVEVRLEARLAGGRTLSSRFTTPWEQLPSPARLELLGRGEAAFSRPWSPPWRCG